ncbi:putative Stage III sporulation protein AB [[Clostridium] ultunense Esp]|uniref:Putative Stage III sporulation protein AB n=1 Tax=[Clostridium] ultunense Esp TaxID=1288971 RepID=M1ZDJ3_9FIRM|nr:stage III sporulation protein SpoIIIAB [Schnuerera ultunensis]CCQ95993.1 putative Stage III sporulation protein AB [[Clostridium] ultunense Esp]SHD77169.1 putative Stage III sporulation protein AB [[Clostridium] ultunense Esp]
MGLFKFLGGLLIILSTTSMGFHYGSRFANRFDNLIFLEQCFKILETEIVYGAVPLPEALTNVYNKGNKKVSFIFEEIKIYLLNNKKGDVFNSFTSVATVLRDRLNLKEGDIEIFLSLGRVLGSSDRQDQEKNFKLILNQIAILQKEAKLERDKNEKMYKNLGILTGIAIVIILL